MASRRKIMEKKGLPKKEWHLEETRKKRGRRLEIAQMTRKRCRRGYIRSVRRAAKMRWKNTS